MGNENSLKNLQKFDSKKQPSPEAKSKGWERRRVAQEIMNEMDRIKLLTYAELEEMKRDIKIHPEKYTVLQVKLMQYMSSSKFTVDWLDRHISKATHLVDVTSGGEKIEAGIFVTDFKDGNNS